MVQKNNGHVNSREQPLHCTYCTQSITIFRMERNTYKLRDRMCVIYSVYNTFSYCILCSILSHFCQDSTQEVIQGIQSHVFFVLWYAIKRQLLHISTEHQFQFQTALGLQVQFFFFFCMTLKFKNTNPDFRSPAVKHSKPEEYLVFCYCLCEGPYSKDLEKHAGTRLSKDPVCSREAGSLCTGPTYITSQL